MLVHCIKELIMVMQHSSKSSLLNDGIHVWNVIIILLIVRCFTVVNATTDTTSPSQNGVTPQRSLRLITYAATAGLAIASSAGHLAYYRLYENCDSPWINQNPDAVKSSLNIEWKRTVFGQDLALKIIRNMLVSHLRRVATGKSKKPLVLSFHGGIGTGKTLVGSLLAKVLYKKGENSSFVYRLHLVDMLINTKTVNEKRNVIKNEIKTIIRRCGRPLIIFEEIDKLEEAVIDVLFPYFDQQYSVGNIDFRKAIFVFSSNIGAREISYETCIQFNKTQESSDFDVEQFYHIIRQASYNGLSKQQSSSQFSSRGGFTMAKFIKHCLISSFVPFLPLEMNHVLKCMEASLTERNDIMKILKRKPDLKGAFFSLIYPKISRISPPGCTKTFSVNGCKRVSAIIDQEVDSFFYPN